MRKILETVGFAALAFLAWITLRAFYGPNRLAGRIPMHFDSAGHPDAWGSPFTLLLLPGLAAGIYLLISLLARNATEFNFPVRVTPQNRARLEALALDLIAWLKSELAWTFAAIQWFTIRVAAHQRQEFPPALIPLTLAAIFVTVGLFIAAMFLAARTAAES